jgi:hypothetical protein
MTPAEQLALYRSDHRIKVNMGLGREFFCEVDLIRVLPVKGDRFRHDPDQIVHLIDQEYGHIWPSQVERTDKAAVEVARDIIREDLYPLASKGAKERTQDVYDDDPNDADDWTNREGQPEFNGSFR